MQMPLKDHVWSLVTITSQKHGGALIRAGALNGDNTVLLDINGKKNMRGHFFMLNGHGP